MSKREMLIVTCVMLVICMGCLLGAGFLRQSKNTAAASLATVEPATTMTRRQSASVRATAAVNTAQATINPLATSEAEKQLITISTVTGRDIGKASSLLERNREQYAEILTKLYTKQRGVVFIFTVDDEESTRAILVALNHAGGKGTFFVDPEQIEAKMALLRDIVSAGHDLGFSLTGARYVSSEDMLATILEAETSLRTQVGYSNEICLRQESGNPSTMLRVVASAGGYTLVQQTTRVAAGKALLVEGANGMSTLFDASALSRGDIVSFRVTDGLTSSALRNLMEHAASQTKYQILPLSDMLSSKDRFSYPVAADEMLPSVKGKVRQGSLTGDAFSVIQSRYIGVVWNRNQNFMPGFTKEEIRLLDKTGMIENYDKQVFLTFDGWGTEACITRLLEVLNKHDVRAMFFVRTQDAGRHPSLLREIAEAGHGIGSNTHTGMSLAQYESKGKFADLTEKQTAALKEDIVKSYDTLANIIGDLPLGGRGSKPALTTLFRPPLLTVSRSGLEAVLGCGYTYSVSGAYTFEFDDNDSSDKLLKNMKANMKSGMIVIFHLDDMPDYYIDGIDKYLTQNKGTSKFDFACLADVL